MTPQDFIREARERLEAATPGPWVIGHWEDGSQLEDEWNVFAPGSEVTIVTDTVKVDAEFIAHAPTDLRLALQMLEIAVASLLEVEQQGNSCAVVCRRCGDEESLQDADFMFEVREALTRMAELVEGKK